MPAALEKMVKSVYKSIKDSPMSKQTKVAFDNMVAAYKKKHDKEPSEEEKAKIEAKVKKSAAWAISQTKFKASEDSENRHLNIPNTFCLSDLIEQDSVTLQPKIGSKPVFLAREGTWDHPVYGTFSITASDLEDFKTNFDLDVRRQQVPIDVDHKPSQGGAAAWMIPGTMFLNENEGKKSLWVSVEWTNRGQKLVLGGEYRYISPTYDTIYTDEETGDAFRNVLAGAALTISPVIKGQKPISLSEDVMKDEHKDDKDMKDKADIMMKKEGPVAKMMKAKQAMGGQSMWEMFSNIRDMISSVMDNKELDVNAKKSKAREILSDIPETLGPAMDAMADCDGIPDSKMMSETIKEKEETVMATEQIKVPEQPPVPTQQPQVQMSAEAASELQRQLAEAKKSGDDLTRQLAEEREARLRHERKLDDLQSENIRSKIRLELTELLPNASGNFRILEKDKESIEGLLFELNMLDEVRNEATRKLSQGVVPKEQESKLKDRVLGIIKSLPEQKLNLGEKGSSDGGEKTVDEEALVDTTARRLMSEGAAKAYREAVLIARDNLRRDGKIKFENT